jgi:predicted ATPase/DNA-binding SARP family transcriptional activator/predicted negative regulator of RcsB-dependent stress response
MSGLTLKLLGTPEVIQDKQAVAGFHSIKVRALLYYVAAGARPQARTKLAGLLWGELSDVRANANLRKTLTNLRHLVGPYLTISRDTVALNENNPPWLDVREFETALQSGDPTGLQTAVDLYRGDFLDGFYLRAAPEFETWLLAQRHRLREQLLAALQRLAEYEAGKGHVAAAIDHLQHLLALEPLREEIHRLLMHLLAQDDQRARALAQYEACAQILAAELGVEPGQKTTALFNQIRDGTLTPALAATPAATALRHNLPAPTTSFVGREAELARLKTWLATGDNRLLTIVGPGGVGKTRLALQAAWTALDDLAGGAWYISLVSLEDTAGLAAVMASTLGISFFGKASLEAQVVRYLRRKELLLVLDNAEHLISQTLADFLMEILTQAPAVRIMATSRERLVMQAEQVLALPGLAYTDEEKAAAGLSYPAGQLFRQRAEGHGHPLPATPEVNRALQRLCQLVEGLPLALELAAAWVNTTSLNNMVAEIERGLDFLATDLRDLPLRQRSIQAVFETSWKMLEGDERRVMRQLACFRGGFSVDAAAVVASATPAQLQTLANKSLIRAQGNGRYDLHELIRQYAAGKLAQRPAEAEAVARRHGHYFADFLARREEAIQGTGYLQAKAEIQVDVDNVRKAWEWAVAAPSLEDIARSAETLHYYFLNTQGLFTEAAQRFQRAAAQIAAHATGAEALLVGRLLLKAAINRRLLGQLEEAGHLAEESLSIFYRQEFDDDVARASSTLGVIRLQQNEKEAALHLAETAVDQARDLDAPVTLCLCLNNLAYVLAHNGKHKTAIARAEESAALAQAIGYPHGELSAMNMLGVYYERTGDVDKAQAIFEELVARCRKTATQSRLAQAVNNLGSLYKKHGQPDKARPLLQEGVRLYEAVGQVHYAAFVTVMLGEIIVEQGSYQEARSHCRQALQIGQEIEMPALTLSALVLHARLLMAQGKDADATSILTLVAQHPAALVDTKEDAQQALQTLQAAMPPPAFGAAADIGTGWALDDVAGEVMGFLAQSSLPAPG